MYSKSSMSYSKGSQMTPVERLKQLIKQNPPTEARSQVAIPRHVWFKGVANLDEMIGHRIRVEVTTSKGRIENREGNMLGWYQLTDNGILHTWLCVKVVGYLNPLMVYESEYRGFAGYSVGNMPISETGEINPDGLPIV